MSGSPSLEIQTWYEVDSDRRTTACSSPPLRYTGDGKVTVVTALPSSEILTFAGSITTSLNG